jgi:hypothetical protein
LVRRAEIPLGNAAGDARIFCRRLGMRILVLGVADSVAQDMYNQRWLVAF